MKCIIFLLGFFFGMTNLFSQSSGYMGKRTHISYGFNFSPAIFGATANNTSIIGTSGNAETGEPAFNMLHDINLDYIVSSKWMIGLNVRYYKTAYDNAEYIRSAAYFAYEINSSRPNRYYSITGLSYGTCFKYFGNRYVAPWGRYVMFAPVLNTYKASYDPKIMYVTGKKYNGSYYNDSDTTISNFGNQDEFYKGFNIMAGWGRSRVLGDRITLDYGANFHVFSLLTALFDGADIDVSSYKAPTPETYIESTIRKRVRGINRFNVFFKVGILMF